MEGAGQGLLFLIVEGAHPEVVVQMGLPSVSEGGGASVSDTLMRADTEPLLIPP